MSPLAFAGAWVGGLSFVFVLAIILRQLYLWLVCDGRQPSPERLEKWTTEAVQGYRAAQKAGDGELAGYYLARMLRLYQTKGVRFRG